MIIATPSSTTARCWSILARTAWLKSSTKVFRPVATRGWPLRGAIGAAERDGCGSFFSLPLAGSEASKARSRGRRARASRGGVFEINRTFRQLRPPPDHRYARSRCEASAYLFPKGRRPKVAYAPSPRLRGGGKRTLRQKSNFANALKAESTVQPRTQKYFA